MRKRWRYVGVYTPEVMLCVGQARIGPIPRRWWAVALPDGELFEGSRGVRIDGSRVRAPGIDLRLIEGPREATTTGPIWTAKQACVPVKGSVSAGGRSFEIDSPCGFIDDSEGHHPRHTVWKWSAGVGVAADGRAVGWNLVDGIHDSDTGSERRVWIEGEAHEVPHQEFADDLSAVGGLAFEQWSTREENANLLLLRSRYRQPFGTFTGTLPGNVDLRTGYGVMEEHDVYW